MGSVEASRRTAAADSTQHRQWWGRSHRGSSARRVLAILVVLATGFAVAPAAAKAPRAQRGSYDVTARPLPNTWSATRPGGVGAHCLADGVEGVHKVTKPFRAPAAGTLTLSIKKFTGDWDLSLLDGSGDSVGSGGTSDQVTGAPGTERVVARVQTGETLRMVVCNSASAQATVRVDYEYTPGLRGPAAKVAKGYRFLAPNQPADLHERVPVNVVFIGYEPRTVPAKPFVAALPKVSRPIERGPRWYGIDRPVGLTYTYDYDLTYASAAYENRFFAELRRLGVKAARTEYQHAYNAQKDAVREVTHNYLIDAPSVERWLAKHPPAGVNTRENTVFLINWFGRKDFRFHLYSKTDEPVSGVRKNRGRFDWAHGVAWGGSTPNDPENGLGGLHRIWFHDLSAGPEAWSDQWEVDTPDLDGDGAEDYRMPPIWEYADPGYRDRDELAGDLAKIVRYVAVNLLFTPSPLYPVAPQAPHIPAAMDVDHNVFQMDPDVDAGQRKYFDPAVVQKVLADLMPLTKVTVDDTQELDATDPKFQQCYQSYYYAPYAASCHPEYGYSSWADPFVHAAVTRGDWADDTGRPAYEAGGFTYTSPEASASQAGVQVSPCYAYADDNWRDGTQSFVHQFIDNRCANALGLTDIFIHEFGHHVGMSHPHDGFDYERGLEYSAWWTDELYFVALGDEVSSVMSYQWYNNDFSQFDRDNRNRWLTAAYVTQVNALAGALLKKSARAVGGDLRRADRLVGEAHAALRRHDYLAASKLSKAAYDTVVAATLRTGGRVHVSNAGTTAEKLDPAPAVPSRRDLHRYVGDEFTSLDGVAVMVKPGLPLPGLPPTSIGAHRHDHSTHER